MMRRSFLGLLGTAALVPLIGCTRRLPTYRYRMTVTVDTPEGARNGSSVIKVRTTQTASFPGPEAGGFRNRVRGEAVTVDLGERGTLFALLRGDQSGDAAFYAPAGLLDGAPMNTGSADQRRAKLQRLIAIEEKAHLRREVYPMLVRFRDIEDPTSVERVDPDDLAASFGEGVSLRQITVEITDDRETEGIEDVMPHFGDGSGYAEWYRTLEYGDPRRIGPGDFRSG